MIDLKTQRRIYRQYVFPVILATLIVTSAMGCRRVVVPPPSPEIDPEISSNVTVTIDGIDVEQKTPEIRQGMEILVKGAYRLRPVQRVDWDQAHLQLIRSGRTGDEEVVLQRFISSKRAETLLDGQLVWELMHTNGRDGRAIVVDVPAGEYELRLCWERFPKTVQERIRYKKDIRKFQTPFYSARLRVTISN